MRSGAVDVVLSNALLDIRGRIGVEYIASSNLRQRSLRDYVYMHRKIEPDLEQTSSPPHNLPSVNPSRPVRPPRPRPRLFAPARDLECRQRSGPPTQRGRVPAARHVARPVGQDRPAPIREHAPAVTLARVLDARDGVPERRAVRDAGSDGHGVAGERVDVERPPRDVVLAASERGPPVG